MIRQTVTISLASAFLASTAAAEIPRVAVDIAPVHHWSLV